MANLTRVLGRILPSQDKQLLRNVYRQGSRKLNRGYLNLKTSLIFLGPHCGIGHLAVSGGGGRFVYTLFQRCTITTGNPRRSLRHYQYTSFGGTTLTIYKVASTTTNQIKQKRCLSVPSISVNSPSWLVYVVTEVGSRPNVTSFWDETFAGTRECITCWGYRLGRFGVGVERVWGCLLHFVSSSVVQGCVRRKEGSKVTLTNDVPGRSHIVKLQRPHPKCR